jgi:hypothetical protein
MEAPAIPARGAIADRATRVNQPGLKAENGGTSERNKAAESEKRAPFQAPFPLPAARSLV